MEVKQFFTPNKRKEASKILTSIHHAPGRSSQEEEGPVQGGT